MNKREYIQDLISKGFNDDEILYKLDNEFKEPTDPPKKKQDPATAETSVGSSKDMVSSSEDGSLVSRDKTIETEIELPGMKDMPELERQFASGELTKSDLEGMGLIVSDDGKINVQSVGQVEIKVKAKEKEEDLTWLERKFGKNNATDFFGDIYRSFKSGYAQGESFDSAIELFKQGTTDEEIKKYLSDVRNLENFHGTDEMLQFEDDYSRMSEKYGPVAGFFYGAWRNPSIMHQYASQSLGNMAASVQTGEAIASAASAGAGGAGAGALVSGPGGAIVGGGAGFIGGLSGAMEVGFTTADLLKDEIDKELISSGASTRWDNMGDEQRFSYVSDILNNPVKKNELRNRALRRGIAIGTFDAVTGALTQGTGKVVTGAVKKATRSAYKASSKVAKTTTRVSAKLAPTIARGTTETTMGIASEYAGQIAAGQEIDTKDALIEGLAGDKIFTIAGMATDAIAANGKYKINGQKLGFNEFTESIKKMDDIAFTEARIDVEGDDVIKAIVDNRREDIKIDQSIDAKISDANDRADLIRLEREISQLKSSESETNKNKIANLREKVKKISDAYIDADVDVSIEDRQLAIANAARNRVENEFNDNAKKVESAARDVEGVEIKKFDTTSEVEEYLNSVGDDVDVKKAAGQQGFIIQNSKTGKQQIILNKEQALKDNAVTVASHEFLHGILFNTVNKNTSNAISLGNALLKRLNSIDINKIENSEFKNRMLQYADESKEVRMEEALTLFSDALATGDIKYNENTFTKIGDTVRRTLQRNFGINIKFNNGRDVYNFIKDYNKSIEEGGLTQAQAKLAVEGGKGRLIQEGSYTDTEGDVKYSRASVLEEINNLIPENIETKEQFLSDRSFTKVYESVMMPGGVINNYIKSKSSSPMEAELAIDSVVDRLMNFDPQAKRKDGSTIGREGFGEFIFANTAFGKRDAKKALYEESQRKAKQTSIDDSVREIADVETVEEETTIETKEKPSINPLKFSGVPDKVTISDKPGEGLTFKNVSKKYAGEVGEQILGVPAKKITDASANLGSVNEARAIQQFFFRADNLDKFVSILPEYNIATPEARVEGKDIDVSKTIQGTGIGLPKRILDYFYDDFIDPSGKLTSPKGRSKGLTSQVPVRRLKPEFRGIVSKETIDKLKLDIGITPKGELNILPKNELRSSLGQLIKGMAKTYSTLAANTLVRQELKSAGATEKQLADVAAGKARVMLSKAAVQKSKNVFMRNDSFEKSSDEFAAENKVWKAILAPLNLTLPSSKDAADIESVRTFVREKLTKVLPKSFFTGGTFANAGTSAAKRGFFYVSMEEVYNDIDGMSFAPEDVEITAAVSRDSYSKLDEKINTKQFRERQDQSINGLRKIFKAFEKLIKENPENAKYVAAILSSSSQSMAHFVRTSAPINFYSVENGKPLTGGGKVVVEEHTLPASLVGKYLFGAILDGTLDESFVNIKNNYQQGLLSKVNDKKLKGFKPNGKPYNYIASTPEGWKITDNIFARYFNENVATNNGGINPSEIVMYDGETILEKYNVDSSGFATTVQLEKQKEVAFKNNVKVAYSKAKNNSELLNDLKNRDKAIANARNAKAPRKGITVFDFDDTLATSKSMVGVTMPDGTTKKIDATEFAKQGEELADQGAVFDFSDFSKVVNGQPGPLISKLEKAINKFGNKDIYVLTARPANSAPAIYEFLKGVGYEIPLENITGLQNSSPEAKAQWMVEKAALGYNDFYFVDDAYKNVKAVQDAMKVLDVKSKERIVYKDAFDKLNKEFNDILEAKTGIAADKMYSDAKAEVVGAGKGKYKFFIPPSAEDFVGLLYTTLSRGKLGDNQMAWYKKNLIDPYARAMNNIANERMSLVADYKALKKNLKIVPKNLRKKIPNEGFTKEQAVRIYIWNQQGFEVPGLSKSDLNEMTKYVFNNPELRVFADQLIAINKGDGYIGPNEGWLAGSITTDLMAGLQITKRAKHLEQWQANVDVIFSKQNLNKLEAAYGSNYREALENMLKRMKSGKNRNFDGDSNTGRFLDWVNGSTGAIMFFNTRSALLQTISAVNFINWSDNNILKASAAFANQPQYWKDFAYLFNSDFLKERRNNLTINVNEADIAEMASKGGVRGAISYILQKGFLPTQFADSFAIASGGATFYRNRLKSYLKEGLSQSEAEQKAFDDFREATEESQQSSRPDRISQQQAGPLGRIVLAFANTPSQYARIIKKASMDLAAGRGDAKVNISKILYYGAVQGIIFNAIQSALFAADFEDEEEMDEKYVRMANGMADGILRGIGVGGAVASTVKGGVLKAIEESEKKRPNYEKVAFEMTKISPPISSKLSRLNQAAREVQWNKKEMSKMGWSLDNPAWLASANVISATTNIPADRVIKKINNIDAAYSQDLEMWERMALLGGWSEWELGIQDDKKKKQTGGRVEAGSRVGSGIRVGGGRRVK